MADDLEARYELARHIAIDAGRLTLRYFRKLEVVEQKEDGTPVTVADRGAEELARERVHEAFPADGLLGEEFGEIAGSSGYRWIIDPIDGTKSFISGVPLYGTMVAVEWEGRCRIGAIYFPPLDELLHACQGRGAWFGSAAGPAQRARVNQTARLADGLLVTSELRTFHQRQAGRAYEQFEQAAGLNRAWGDCYGYCLVATGRAVAMVDPILSIWDAAAVQPILAEAGGQFTDWQGRESIVSGDGIGANPLVLEEVLSITRPFGSQLGPAAGYCAAE